MNRLRFLFAAQFLLLWIPATVPAEPQDVPKYRDHQRLLYYLDEQAREEPIKSADDWSIRRRHILQGMEQAMGPLPDRSELPDLDLKEIERIESKNFSRLTISFVVETGDRLPALLYLPTDLKPGERRPAMLALHPTSALGKRVVAGEGQKPDRNYGLELAERGYVVLCPDYPSFGDYSQYNFAEDDYVSGTMKGIFNHMRCVDLLASRAEVDPERIGVIGHSLGGHNAMFVAAFDERLRAVVASCGWTPFHDYYGGKLDGWASDRYMPRLRDVYGLDPARVPFDFYEVVAALAPRAFFSCSPTGDGNFDVRGVKKATIAAQAVYDLLGAGEQLQVRHPDAEHDFPDEVRSEAYLFLDKVLKLSPSARQSARDYSQELTRIPPKEPKEALETFHTLPGFRLEQVAAEPLVYDPVAMAFDDQGRLFVAEMRDYSEQARERLGRIRLLEDKDADGRFDISTIHVDDLSWPTAVACYEGGVFIGAAPDILYCKDTDGDGLADVRKVVFTGFGRSNVQGLLNSFHWGLDNRIHGATSTAGGRVRRPESPESETVDLNGRDFSFDPRKLDLRPETGGAQHGMSFDDWGRKFVSSNSDHLQMVMLEDRYLARNPFVAAPAARHSIAADGPQAEVFRISPVEPWRIVRTRLRVAGEVPGPIEGGGRPAGYFTGATGATIYRGDAWPAEYRGQAFIGDVGSNIVHRKVLQADGVGFKALRVDVAKEFLASTDTWFRPVQFANAPDGALYIADMYREVIEHPASLPPQIKQHLDLTSGRDRGRIYRIVPEDFRQPEKRRLDRASTEQLVDALADRGGWYRDTAQRLLYERQDPSAVEPLQALVANSTMPEARVHALYALQGLAALSDEALLTALKDDHPRVREHAVRLSERYIAAAPPLREQILAMVGDEDLRVRYQLAFSLGEVQGSQGIEQLTELARNHAGDRWISLALLSSLHDKAAGVGASLLTEEKFRQSQGGSEFLEQVTRLVASHGDVQQIQSLTSAISRLPKPDLRLAGRLYQALQQVLRQKHPILAVQLAASKEGSHLLEKLLASAKADAVNDNLDVEFRREAIQQLSAGRFADVHALLNDLLAPQHAPEVQAATIKTLAAFTEPEVANILLANWSTFTPSTRMISTDVLLSRPLWIRKLLEAIAAGRFAARDIETSHWRLLEKHPDEGIRRRASELLAEVALSSSQREELLQTYATAIKNPGDTDRGREVFARLCAACHRAGNIGHEIGPNLAAVVTRGADAILLNVLDPNREVNPQYINYLVVTQDGRTLSGMLAGETATSVTLRRAENATDTVSRADIEAIRSSGVSIMPEGFEKEVDPGRMADLMAFLLSLK